MLEGLGIPGASDDDRLAHAAQGFDGLPSRCRSLGSVGAVEFVDDGLSTNVLPAQAALQAFADRPVALLVGGHDRGLDYAPLGRTLAARTAPTLVVTMPDNGPRIGQAVRDATGGQVEVLDATEPGRSRRGRVRVGPGRWRGPALAGRAQLRALRRLPGALGGLRRGGRPPGDAQLSGVSRLRRRAPAPHAR